MKKIILKAIEIFLGIIGYRYDRDIEPLGKILEIDSCWNCPYGKQAETVPNNWILTCKSSVAEDGGIIGYGKKPLDLYKLPFPVWCPLKDASYIKELEDKVKQLEAITRPRLSDGEIDALGEALDKMEDKPILKPCPLCNSAVNIESTRDKEIIHCSLCPLKIEYEGSQDALIAMWNTRGE